MRDVRPRSAESGASALEMALVLPLFLMLVFGILMLGGFFFTQALAQVAITEGARAAALGEGAAGTGYARVDDVLRPIGAGGPAVAQGAIIREETECDHELEARLAIGPVVTVPMLGRVRFALRSGTITPVAKFFPLDELDRTCP